MLTEEWDWGQPRGSTRGPRKGAPRTGSGIRRLRLRGARTDRAAAEGPRLSKTGGAGGRRWTGPNDRRSAGRSWGRLGRGSGEPSQDGEPRARPSRIGGPGWEKRGYGEEGPVEGGTAAGGGLGGQQDSGSARVHLGGGTGSGTGSAARARRRRPGGSSSSPGRTLRLRRTGLSMMVSSCRSSM